MLLHNEHSCVQVTLRTRISQYRITNSKIQSYEQLQWHTVGYNIIKIPHGMLNEKWKLRNENAPGMFICLHETQYRLYVSVTLALYKTECPYRAVHKSMHHTPILKDTHTMGSTLYFLPVDILKTATCITEREIIQMARKKPLFLTTKPKQWPLYTQLKYCKFSESDHVT